MGVSYDEPTTQANARLVAAAPSLLAALQRMQKQLRDKYADHGSDWTGNDSDAYEQASAAIRAAVGTCENP
jgi:long-subunit fatty acid transport protein